MLEANITLTRLLVYTDKSDEYWHKLAVTNYKRVTCQCKSTLIKPFFLCSLTTDLCAFRNCVFVRQRKIINQVQSKINLITFQNSPCQAYFCQISCFKHLFDHNLKHIDESKRTGAFNFHIFRLNTNHER